MGELLYELPGVPGTCPWEPLLDDLNGLNGQGKVGGDSEYLFVAGGTMRIWREGDLGLSARSHALILSLGGREDVGVRRARVSLLVPRPTVLLTKFRG